MVTSFPLTFNFPLSVLPAFACLILKNAFACGGQGREWAGSVMDFLPEVIHIEVVERLYNYFFLKCYLWAAASVSSWPGLPHAHSFSVHLRIARIHMQQYECDHLPGNKTFKRLFLSFLPFKSFITFLLGYAHIFSLFICKSTPSSVDHSSFGIRIALRIRWHI